MAALRNSPRGCRRSSDRFSSLRAVFWPGPHGCPRLLGRVRPGLRARRSSAHPRSELRLLPPLLRCLPWDRTGNVRALLGFGFGNGDLPCHPSRQRLRGHFVPLVCPGLSIRAPPEFPQRGYPGNGSCFSTGKHGQPRAGLNSGSSRRGEDVLPTSPGALLAAPGPPGQGQVQEQIPQRGKPRGHPLVQARAPPLPPGWAG